MVEVASRGWIAGDAATFYNTAVKAHMDQFNQFNAGSVIYPAIQAAYLLAHPFNPATAFEQINRQYWVASFLNGSEAWANFRRSNYPALSLNADPSAEFKADLTFPTREQSEKFASYKEAFTRMGGDNLGLFIFWDKQ